MAKPLKVWTNDIFAYAAEKHNMTQADCILVFKKSGLLARNGDTDFYMNEMVAANPYLRNSASVVKFNSEETDTTKLYYTGLCMIYNFMKANKVTNMLVVL